MTNQINNQSLIPSTDEIQLTLTLKMTTAPVVETSVTVNNSPIHDYVHPDDHTQPTYEMTPQLNVELFVNDKIACLPPSITPNVTKKTKMNFQKLSG